MKLNANNNLENIPHMLRNLAEEIESGERETPRMLLIVEVPKDNLPPLLFHFGKDVSRIESVGALNICAVQLADTTNGEWRFIR